MAQSAMTVRLDSQMKAQFDSLCEQFGMSANTAINIFVNAVVRSKSIPFSINLKKENVINGDEFKRSVEAIRKQAAKDGISEMTLEEINEEIRLAREERKQRLAQ